MDTTRRGFLAVAGAAVAGDAVHAQDHDHDDHAHQALPSDPALPRYARSKVGTIVRDHGVFAFEDTNASERQFEKPQHVYSVRFSAQELWGQQASPRHAVYIEMWDDYLEHA